MELSSVKFPENDRKTLYMTRISAFEFDKLSANMRIQLDTLRGEQDCPSSRNKTNRFSFVGELLTFEKLGDVGF